MKNRVLENEKVIQCVYFVIHCISVCYDDAFFLYEKRGDHRRETRRFSVESRTDPLREMNWKFIRCYKSNE